MTSASPATLSSIARGASGPPIAVRTQPGCMVSTEARRKEYEDAGKEGARRQRQALRPFAVGRHAVTRGQFAAFLNNTGYNTEGGAYVWAGKPLAAPVVDPGPLVVPHFLASDKCGRSDY